MPEYYPLIKHGHVGLVYLSISLFSLRALATLAGMQWPRWRAVRIASYVVDSALLLTAFTLAGMLPAAYFANGWLLLKLLLLPCYIGLGFGALRARRRGRQLALLLAAWLVFAQMFGIARMHHPLGWLLLW